MCCIRMKRYYTLLYVIFLLLFFTCAIIFLSYRFIGDLDPDIEFSILERKGIHYHAQLFKLQKYLQRYRGTQIIIALDPNNQSKTLLSSLKNNIKEQIAEVEDTDVELSEVLKSTLLWSEVRQDISDITLPNEEDIGEALKNNSNVIKSLMDFMQYIGDTSNLILDPELISYYIMDININVIPDLLYSLGYVRDQSLMYFLKNDNNKAFLTDPSFVVNKSRIEKLLQQLKRAYGIIFQNDRTLYQEFSSKIENLNDITLSFMDDDNLIHTKDGNHSELKPFQDSMTIGDGYFELYFQNAALLDKLIKARLDKKNQAKNIVIGFTGIIIFILCGFYYILHRNFFQRLQAEDALVATNENLEIKLQERLLELRTKEVDLQTILDTVIEGVITLDHKGKIQSANLATEKIFNYTNQEILNLNIKDIIDSKYIKELAAELRPRTLDDDNEQAVIVYEVEGIRNNKTIFPLTIAIKEMQTTTKELRFVGMLHDITERKQNEDKLRTYSLTLEQQKKELLLAKELAERANMAKSEFLANMSHELRTPMHAIMGFTRQGAKRIETWSPQEQLDNFTLIRESAERLLGLLNALLDLSKLEAGGVQYNFKPTMISEAITPAITQLNSLIEQKNMYIKVDGVNQAPMLNFDVQRIIQVIVNLLSNAIKFSNEKKSIVIDVKKYDEQFYKISIIDQGIGIPEDELEHVFDKFIQSKKTKTGAGGTGLGLTICKEIVIAHGGKIWAENMSSSGACFSFTLPIATQNTGA